MGCQNNLKQIGLAVQNYHETMHHLPPPKFGTAATTFLDVRMFVLILPYLEGGNRYAQIRPDKTVTEPAESIAQQRIAAKLLVPIDVPAAIRTRCGLWGMSGTG